MTNKEMAVCYDSQCCIKCYSCVVSCAVENRVRQQRDKGEDIIQTINEKEPYYNYLTVVQNDSGTFPDIKNVAALKHCHHCEHPKCLEICPTGAITKSSSGAVVINENLCVGCQGCVDTCPYDIPVYSQEKGRTYKCIMCEDRLNAGLKTACAEACPSVAIFSGNRDQVLDEARKRAEKYSQIFGKEYIVYGADPVNNHVGSLSYITIVSKEDQDAYLLPKDPVSKTAQARDVLKTAGTIGAVLIGAGAAIHTASWIKNKKNSPYNHSED